jgi:DNA-binding CsgD family transcriptional regulator
MSSIRQYLLAHRLLPQQFVRLDGELFGRLEALAAAQGRTVHDLVIDALYAAVYTNRAQAAYDQLWSELTHRGQQVAALVCLGYTNHEIARHLTISVNTVRSHVRNVLDKFQVTSKAELRLILANWNFDDWLEATGTDGQETW